MQRIEMSYFDELPPELVDRLCVDFTAYQLAAFSQTNKRHYEIADRFWREKVKAYFPDRYLHQYLIQGINWKRKFKKFYAWELGEVENAVLKKIKISVAESDLLELVKHENVLLEMIGKDSIFYKLMISAAHNNDKPLLNFFYQLIARVYKEELGNERNRALKIDSYGSTILHAAVICHQPISTLEYLISTGVDINHQDSEDQFTAAFVAAKFGRLELFKWLMIRSNMPIIHNDEDSNDWSWLHVAAKYGQLAIIEYLLQTGMDINAKDTQKDRALTYAANYNHTLLFNYLIKKGAIVREDDFKRVANCKDNEIFQVLLKKGARIDLPYKFEVPLVVYAAEHRYFHLMLFLLSCGTDIDVLDKEEKSLIHHVIGLDYGDADEKKWAMESLLLLEPQVRGFGKRCYDPIFYAVRQGLHQLVQLLLPYYQVDELNSLYFDGMNLLHVAASGTNACVFPAKERNYIKTIEVLLSYGLNFFQLDKYGRNIYFHAIQTKYYNGKESNRSILDALMKYELNHSVHGVVDNNLKLGSLLASSIVKADRADLLPIFRSFGFSINVANEKGESFLWQAFNQLPIHVARALIEYDNLSLNQVEAKTFFVSAIYREDERLLGLILARLLTEKNVYQIDNGEVSKAFHSVFRCQSHLMFGFLLNQLETFIKVNNPHNKNSNLIPLLIRLTTLARSSVLHYDKENLLFVAKLLNLTNTALKDPTLYNIQRCKDYAELCQGRTNRSKQIAGIVLMVCGAILATLTLAFVLLTFVLTLGLSVPISIAAVASGGACSVALAGAGLGLFHHGRRSGLAADVHEVASEIKRKY